MIMDRFTDVLASLEKEGYDFSVFVKERDKDGNFGTVKFSYAYVTPAAEQILPLSVWDLVEDESIFKAEKQRTRGHKLIVLPLKSRCYVEEYLDAAFNYLRQVPCKSIAKVWIKVIEPRKKTKYPYIKGEVTKPDWWPREVQHREPDHLQKEDRLRLMSSIILEVLPQLKDNKIMDELCRTTLALCLFKNEPHKELVIKSIFEISRAMCDDTAETIEVMDLTYLRPRSKLTQLKGFKKAGKPCKIGRGTCANRLIDCPPKELKVRSPFESLPTPTLADMLVTNDPGLLDLLELSVGEANYDLDPPSANKHRGEIF